MIQDEFFLQQKLWNASIRSTVIMGFVVSDRVLKCHNGGHLQVQYNLVKKKKKILHISFILFFLMSQLWFYIIQQEDILGKIMCKISS